MKRGPTVRRKWYPAGRFIGQSGTLLASSAVRASVESFAYGQARFHASLGDIHAAVRLGTHDGRAFPDPIERPVNPVRQKRVVPAMRGQGESAEN